MRRTCVSLAGVCMAWCFSVPAAVTLMSPKPDETVRLLPAAQRSLMALPTYQERLAALVKDRQDDGLLKDERLWRRSCPLVLKWSATEWEKAPWTVEIGKSSSLSDARTWHVKATEVETEDGVCSFSVPRANLEIGTRYYWRVSCRGRCKRIECSRRHGCEESKNWSQSEVMSFVTDETAPRWISLEGRTCNVRDLGGRCTADGSRVRQGMIFRGQAFNDNSVTGDRQGQNRLTVEDVHYLTETLGIKTDLDLRNPGETADLASSPLGKGVRLMQISSYSYYEIFEWPQAKKALAEDFRVFCNPSNYPVYFHCIAGADRTGTLAYVLNGVLGVGRHDLETDWESTFYPVLPEMRKDFTGPRFLINEQHFNDGFAKYGGPDVSWNERIVCYLKKECGITEGEIELFRSIMLENGKGPVQTNLKQKGVGAVDSVDSK